MSKQPNLKDRVDAPSADIVKHHRPPFSPKEEPGETPAAAAAPAGGENEGLTVPAGAFLARIADLLEEQADRETFAYSRRGNDAGISSELLHDFEAIRNLRLIGKRLDRELVFAVPLPIRPKLDRWVTAVLAEVSTLPDEVDFAFDSELGWVLTDRELVGALLDVFRENDEFAEDFSMERHDFEDSGSLRDLQVLSADWPGQEGGPYAG